MKVNIFPQKIKFPRARIAIICARFNAEITDGLKRGALTALKESGVKKITTLEVSGSFELPLAAKLIARTRKFDAAVALGAVIRGKTDHYHHIAREAAHGIAQVSRDFSFPIGFGVLTCQTFAQAKARSGVNKYNIGRQATLAALEMIMTIKRIKK